MAIHHLNYGIFLLAGLGAFFLFGKPTGCGLQAAAVVYGIGMALGAPHALPTPWWNFWSWLESSVSWPRYI
jgi:hypothetical protein